MDIRVIEESMETLTEYEKVSIAFCVRSRFRVQRTGTGLVLKEEPVEPYQKDYDDDPNDHPQSWPLRFDTSNWGVFAAFAGDRRVGGAVAAWKTPDLGLLGSREDLVSLWDLRVDADHRHLGVGHRLFEAVVDWARRQRCVEMVIETQDVNVAACRFYARQGCELRFANEDAYPAELNEIQLLWYRKLEV